MVIHVYLDSTPLLNDYGWTVIQRRIDNTVSFDRGWDDYVNGFGRSETNFWIGLTRMHQFTLTPVPLRINIELFDSEKFSLDYETFSVGDASSNFTLFLSDIDAVYPGALNNGSAFSTRGRDTTKCGVQRHLGGWWYNRCREFLNANGRYDGNIVPNSSSMYMLYIGTNSGAFKDTKPIKSVEITICILKQD